MIDYLIHAPDRATFVAVMAALAHPADGRPLATLDEATGRLVAHRDVRIDEIGPIAKGHWDGEDWIVDATVTALERVAVGLLRGRLAGVLDGDEGRHHGLIKTRPAMYDASGILGPKGEGAKSGVTLPMLFDACEAHGLTPWWQVEWAISREDWIAIADWMGAQAHRFDEIHGELGNENWNSIGTFSLFPSMTDSATAAEYEAGEVYGLYQSMVAGWFEESANWALLAPKLKWHIGGNLFGTFGELALAKFPAAISVDVAAYNGGWDVGTFLPVEDGDSSRKVLMYVPTDATDAFAARESAMDVIAATLGKTIGTDLFHNVYEAGPGYQLNGLNGVAVTDAQAIVQECVMKSRAAAASQLDALLLAAERGWLSNFFTLGIGSTWASHRNTDGGEYLTWGVGRLLWESLGDFHVHRSIALSDPQLAGAGPTTRAYALQSVTTPGKWLYAIINRKIDCSVLEEADPLYNAADDGTVSITLATPHRSATGCRVMTAGIGNMREHDRYPAGYRFNTSKTYDADALCVEFDTSWSTVSVPGDLSRIAIDDALGAGAGGLRGGNFLLVELTGVS